MKKIINEELIKDSIIRFSEYFDDINIIDSIPRKYLPSLLLLFTEIQMNKKLDYNFKNSRYLLIKNMNEFNKIYSGISITTGLALFGTLLNYNKGNIEEALFLKITKGINNTLIKQYDLKKQNSINYFEFINGYCGVLNYFRIIKNEDIIYNIITDCIYLFYKDKHTGTYNWFTSPENSSNDSLALFPNGHYNLGLSHGISAPIALLGLNSFNINEKDEKKVNEAINFIFSYKIKNGWPAKCYKENLLYNRYNSSWCYGFTGIIIAIYNFSIKTNNFVLRKKIKSLYLDLINTIFLDKITYETTICHGLGGILLGIKKFGFNHELNEQLTNRIAQDISIDLNLLNKNLSFLDGEISKILSLNAYINSDETIIEKLLLFL